MKMINIILAPFISILFIMPLESLGQKKINKLINSISNEKLKFEVAKVGTSQMIDSGVVSLPKNLVFVKSLSLQSLSDRDKQRLVSRLIPMLNDNTKDWYANVLLYQLTEREASSLIIIENRDEWVAKHKDEDLKYWHCYLNR